MTGPASTTAPTRRRSFVSSGFTYAKVAEALGLRLCTGLACPWYATDHRRGLALDWTIHWSRTRMTRRGLYEFLRLASRLLFPDAVNVERWLSLWRLDLHARALALSFGVRIPKTFGQREKARVRLDLARISALDTEFPEQRDLIRRARAWSRA